ncbi:WHG domain-containing protein [Streptacidiphilus sp. P02-A3a]|uniref:WHG domain-containing protein n=1 Tax=Streptacidiphilus sp. P02-A3a TaxID=2704468 RepID=UPI001CDC9634|nr:WHG domain-containing protein [Streptacidiphilus sp. P02-A3a]
MRIAYATVRGFGLAEDDLVHAVRALRATLVGFVGLEHGGHRLDTALLTTGLTHRAARR